MLCDYLPRKECRPAFVFALVVAFVFALVVAFVFALVVAFVFALITLFRRRCDDDRFWQTPVVTQTSL